MVFVGYLTNMVDLVILVDLMILVTLVIIVQSVTFVKTSTQTNVRRYLYMVIFFNCPPNPPP